MGLLEIFLLGVALATDAFSVTISNTFAFDDHRFSRLMRMPLFFGLFQFGMPLAGYFVGGIAAELIEKYAGMVSLVILGFIGSNMLYSGYKALKEDASEEEDEEAQQDSTTLSFGKLLFQAVATAIDAFAVGVSFRAHSVDIFGCLGALWHYYRNSLHHCSVHWQKTWFPFGRPCRDGGRCSTYPDWTKSLFWIKSV